MTAIKAKITSIVQGWNDEFDVEQWGVAFEFDLKGDHYEGHSTYCTGDKYEGVNQVDVTLDGISQYAPGHYDADKGEWIEYRETYLSRVLPEDYWTETFIYEVLNPIWEARENAAKVAMGALTGTHVKAEIEEV